MINICRNCKLFSTRIILIAVVAVIYGCMGCGAGNSNRPKSLPGGTATSLDTSFPAVEGSGRAPASEDTAIVIEEPPGNPQSLPPNAQPARSAILGYSYFSHMRQHETRSVYAFISINNPQSVIVSTVKDLSADEIPIRKNDTVTIDTYKLNMLLYKYVDVNLLQNDSDFIIHEVHPSARQEIDSVDGNKWQWNITPKTTKEFTTLTLNVVAEKPNGSRDRFESRNIAIDIAIDKNLNRSVWNWMMDNPGKTLTLVIIPLVAFFGKRLFGDNKKTTPAGKPKKDEEES